MKSRCSIRNFFSKKTDFSKREINQIQQIYEKGNKLQEYLLELNKWAYRAIISQDETDNLVEIIQNMKDADTEVENAIHLYYATQKDEDKKSLEAKYQKYKEYESQWFEFARVVETWLERYEAVKSSKELLTVLAMRGRNLETAKKKLHSLQFVSVNGLLPKIYIDESGLLQKEDNLIFQILIGVDITRIRQCAICRNFFWANRIDRCCCSKECSNVNNKRNSRKNKENSKELYKQSRARKNSLL